MSFSVLTKNRDYKHIAENYTKVNEMQVETGKSFVALLDMKEGNKVLDMGCGTGEITAYIADHVGQEGQVIGIDPDQERITVAIRKHCSLTRSLQFIVGNSSSLFPHRNEGYYDIHFSNFVFHWLTCQEKQVFLDTACKCLKPGGIIAIQTHGQNPEIVNGFSELAGNEIESKKSHYHHITKSDAESLLETSDFVILSSDYATIDYTFPSLHDFMAWCCASDYVDANKMEPHKKHTFAKKFVSENGTVRLVDQANYQIIAQKPNIPY